MHCEKKLLLVCPRFFGYENEIASQAEKAGWKVTYIDTRPENNFSTKVMLRLGANWFIRRKLEKHHDYILNMLLNGRYEKALFINPEGFSERFFLKVSAASIPIEKILYVWDSILNKPLLKPLLNFFDKVYTFDNEDAVNYEKFNFLPLFFTNNYGNQVSLKEDKKYDISFIGTIHSQRMAIVESIGKQCELKGLSFYRYLYIQSRILFWIRKITDLKYSSYRIDDFKFTPLTQQQVADIVARSTAVLDIEHHKQRGLTMRTFEVS
ncbi:hypothetical protein LQ939_12555 [Pantoea alhagi]|uniref:hypothetical protein n=1 Tax=Pantoea alhagi TaxID=1891675 RepID=UPI00202B75FD|nr:hypothetical protein [Pantoea alhagi]URQ59611.1 hypothetical protein LQ939_12555 [Pantoea alhagi]